METNEHKQAGNQIRIVTFANPYLEGSENLSPDDKQTLKVRMMHKVDGIPMPLDLQLSAGDIVALAGDYYTLAGWGLQLQTPQGTDNKEVITKPISTPEIQAFRGAFEDLASSKVKQSDIQRIYAIEKSPLPSLLQQAAYALLVPGYGEKLNNNEAHFSPWSLRAYIVGHRSALRMAHLAYVCKELAAGRIQEDSDKLPAKLKANLQKIRDDKDNNYQFAEKSQKDIYIELGHRYHAMAVARDLFAMHFYSDHFAAGHLSRMGMMRKNLPKNFGIWGGILVNNMHNEDNSVSITASNPFTPVISTQTKPNDEPFIMIREDHKVYGDGTYFQRQNNGNSDMLINGMDNSLGDIARLLHDGTMRQPENYGGLTFLPEIDLDKPQPQPLFIAQGKDIYYRKNVRSIKQLSPEEYANTMANPAAQKDDYEQLTYFKAFLLVLKLRVGGLFFKPEIIKPVVKTSEPLTQSSTKITQGLSEEPAPTVKVTPVKSSWQRHELSNQPGALQTHGFLALRSHKPKDNPVQAEHSFAY